MGFCPPPPPVPPPGWDKMTPAQKAEVHRIDAKYHREIAQVYRSRRSSTFGISLGSFLLGYLFGESD